MHKKNDLAYYMKLKYDVTLKKRGNIFVLIIPELSCIEEDENLDKAYKKLESTKEKYFKKLIELGAQHEIREPKGTQEKKILISTLKSFFIKLLIILFVGGMLFKVASDKLNPEQIIIQEIHRLQDKINTMSAERRETHRLKIGETIKNVKPFVDEFKILWQDTPEKLKESMSLIEEKSRGFP